MYCQKKELYFFSKNDLDFLTVIPNKFQKRSQHSLLKLVSTNCLDNELLVLCEQGISNFSNNDLSDPKYYSSKVSTQATYIIKIQIFGRRELFAQRSDNSRTTRVYG